MTGVPNKNDQIGRLVLDPCRLLRRFRQGSEDKNFHSAGELIGRVVEDYEASGMTIFMGLAARSARFEARFLPSRTRKPSLD